MVEFLKTLAIACIPAIITGIVTYIVVRKNAASQISKCLLIRLSTEKYLESKAKREFSPAWLFLYAED